MLLLILLVILHANFKTTDEMNIKFDTTCPDSKEYCEMPWDSYTDQLLIMIRMIVLDAQPLGFTFDSKEREKLLQFIEESKNNILLCPVDAIATLYAVESVCHSDNKEVKSLVHDACFNAWNYISEWTVSDFSESDMPLLYIESMRKTKAFAVWLSQYVSMDDATWLRARDAVKLIFFLKMKGYTAIDIIELMGKDRNFVNCIKNSDIPS